MSREHRGWRADQSAAIATRIGRVGLAGILAASAALTGVAPAMAASQALIESVPMESGQMPIETFHIAWVSFAPMPFTIIDVDVEVTAEWNATLPTSVGWDSDEVRQGSDLDVSRTALPATGQLTAKWVVTGNVGLFGGNADIPIGTKTTEQTVACNPKVAPGATFNCFVEAAVLTIMPGAGPGSTYVKLGMSTNFVVTPEGVAVARSLTVGNQDVAGPDQLVVGVPAATEALAMPCAALPGDSVEYALDDYSWTPSVEAHHGVLAYVGLMDPSGFGELPASSMLIKQLDSSHEFALGGSGTSFGLGDLQANDIAPTINPMGPFAGTEGSPVQFSASVDSQCPISSRVWQFSNGTTSFGPAPQRAFGDDALYDGQLTITDVTGLSATRSFDVSVSNASPAVNAGPDTSADWGRTVAFNGQATDPGWLDQPTLQYEWEFGDGSPSASGGASVVHQYAAPGVYGAAFKACDNDGACATDSRSVIVTKRDTSLGYTGPTKGAPSKVTTLTAVLVDEYSQPVIGRKVTFTLGTQSAIGTTDANGQASVSFKLTQNKGSYPLAVTFPAGDVKYLDSADPGGVFVIGK
ncbi:MAG TPA: PKD domain-containing protein [Candidatus Limnocylindrales bacterium]|nr:PKD domain-containing protein [Candidatus Limnocylindrales bacterium]